MNKVTTRKKYNDSWIYIFLLSSLVILIESAKSYTLNIFDQNITSVIFLIPFIYAITNYITKVYGFKKGLSAIGISIISLLIYIVLINFAIGKEMLINDLIGGLLGYIISQLVNIMIYKFLLSNTDSPYLLILLNYIFAYIVFYMVYTLVKLNTIVVGNFWLPYFIVLIIQTIMSIFISVIDKKLKPGIGKND